MKRLVRFAAVSMLIAVAANQQTQAANCPFCSAVSQTLRQEMAAMDTVAIARIIPGSESDSDADFNVTSVIRGDTLIRSDQVLKVNYFGKAKPEQNFLLMGVDPPDLLWSSPLPVSDTAIAYVEAITKLPEDLLPRLEFYMDFLEHPEALLARDAYDEFASAPYAELQKLKDKMNREQLIKWIEDTSLPADRKRLYLVMLGICGQPADADLLEKLLRSDDPNRRAGLDAMIACYVTLKGESGLGLIDELFLSNTDCPYADTYQAIMALRFHGTEGGVVKKERVLESMRLILDRPTLADLVIPDLARWQDWSQVEKLVELFKTADEQSSWVRVPVINYLRACPDKEAAAKLDELKELDPAAYKRATSFFPVPKAGTEDDNTSILGPEAARALASDVPLITDRPVAAATTAGGTTRSSSVLERAAPLGLATNANRMQLSSVVGLAMVSLCLAMWISLSGAGSRVLPSFKSLSYDRASQE